MTNTKSADELDAEAAAHLQSAEDSFERCDTDGALSQWAHGISAGRKSAEAELARKGGKTGFLALFDLEGNIAPAKLIEGRYGLCWAFLEDIGDDPDAKRDFTGVFVSLTKGQATYEKKGYRIGVVRSEAWVNSHVPFVGAVGSVYYTAKGQPEDAEIVSDGTNISHIDEAYKIRDDLDLPLEEVSPTE